MIINQYENNIQLPNDSLKNDINSNPSSEFISNLMLNPIKYREFKQNINRINNIDNEINLIKTQDTFNKINFSEIIPIDYEEYKSSIKDAKDIVDSLTDDEILDIISHKKLLSFEKHVLEIYTYLLGQDYFDWKIFRENFNKYDAKIKMSNINYSKLQNKKMNMLLNKISRGGNAKNYLKNDSNISPGLESIYEWVRCQVKIYFYLFQNGLIPKRTLNKIRSKTFTNIGTNTIKPFNLSLSNLFNKKNYDEDRMRNIESMKNILSEKKNLTNYLGKSQNHKTNFLITGLPNASHYSNNNNSQYNNIVSFYLNKNKNKTPKIVQKHEIQLQGINKQEEHEKKEEKICELLPILKYRTFHQMRKYFNMEAKVSKKIEKRHFNDLKTSSIHNDKNTIKILSMIGSNKIGILNNIPLFKIKKIVEES